MTDKQMHGVWANHASYTAGDLPAMVGESTWDEVVASIVSPESALAGAGGNIFVCSRVGDTWIPLAFFKVKTGKSSGINEEQAKKYLNKRASNGAQDSLPSTTPPPAPTVNSDQEGDMVLRLSPHVAGLIRDAFNLIAEGRAVTIQTVPAQPQQ